MELTQEPKPKRHYKQRKKKNLTNWGGAREGAGRPKSNEMLKKSLSVSVSEASYSIYKQIQKRGIQPAKMFEECLANMAALLGIKP